ncbi:cellular communication network factor 5 S homeolog isoform X1 [Xenopus laevis]|uniref:Uncharacterized protein n=2 Tax=Xenopus laevis TaxID=8355 RepID=A0A974BSU0_XENLA|nr:cellular communication network factor 5 S homeolog isoform X1 [Xenopus laevis]OCT60115.1 hypothetical protein XELAEV_18046135mg [Xenopus laevis]
MDLGILNRFLVLLVYCSLPQICAQLCRTPCFCSWIQPRCPPGVPIIVDGCGCCRICARQLGESCDRLYLCDESKELLCDYATGSNGRGTCNYNYDGGCEYNGKEYKDEEVFQPSCKFQCKCMDGGVTCTPLCSENVLLATPECPSPRRVEVPGRCCSEWICDEEQQSPVSNSLEKERSIVSQGRSQIKPLTCTEWGTQWSSCSVSCGLGVSLRVSNRHSLCRLETQVRLCMVRPCRNSPTGAACTPTVHSEHRLRYKTDDCISLREFQPTFCGLCPARHCVPYQTQTEPVAFRCRGSLTWKRIMSIISCVCY